MRTTLAKVLLSAVIIAPLASCKDSRHADNAPAAVAPNDNAVVADEHAPAPVTTTPTTKTDPAMALENAKDVKKELEGQLAVAKQHLAAAPQAAGAIGQGIGRIGNTRAGDMDQTSGDSFHDYGKNAWTDTAKDHLSTFAADVDTASFTIARRALHDGHLPQPASVRVEEFVNYFKYAYDASAATAERPFTVTVDGAPSPFDAGHQILRVGVATQSHAAAQRKRANLVFLVDVSGSMQSPDKLELAKRSLRVMVDNLRDGDTVSLVTYAGDTRVVLPPTGLEHKQRILDALEDLTAGGSTAMASGIELAYQQAARGVAPDAISRVIVLSDGDANVGSTSHDQILASIAGQVKKGITLSTVGFGTGNYHDETMEQLADKGNGTNYYIDSLSAARRVFAEQLGATLEVVAKDVKLQVDFDPAQVASYRLIGYENRDIADDSFRDDKIDAGEVGAGHQVTAMYEVVLTPAADAGKAPIATVRVRHKAPTADQATEAAFPVARGAILAGWANAPADLRLAFSVAAFADVLRGGSDAEQWSLETIRRFASEATGADDRDRADLLSMLDQAIALRKPATKTAAIAE